MAVSKLKRGKDVIATAEAELAKAKSPPSPIYRFRIPIGAETEVIILDASFEDAVGLYEHHYQTANGHWGNYIGCPRNNCSFCRTHGKSQYMIFLTVLSLFSYVKRTGEAVPFSRMLLPIRLSMLPQFQKISSAAMKEAGTLRGACVKVKREDPLQTTWRFRKVVDQKTLIKNYGRQNLIPFDYDGIFKEWAK